MLKQAASGGLGVEPLVHEGAMVRGCTLGRYTEIGTRASVVESELGDYSYISNDTDVIYSGIGKFCSIAAHVRINPGNHPMERASQSHFTYRASRYFPGETDEAEFFDWRRSHAVTIGHDVWIGHGAVVLAGRSIGTGAVLAAGAIVTKDVAPTPSWAAIPRARSERAFRPKSRTRSLISPGGTGATSGCMRPCPISGSCPSRHSSRATPDPRQPPRSKRARMRKRPARSACLKTHTASSRGGGLTAA
jgi:phosphonate metabolism protein (transferase hexapeptide repeat family)